MIYVICVIIMIKKIVTIQLPKTQSPLHLTDIIMSALIYHVSLSSRQCSQTRPYALIFGG
jgi:hypothetical protein